MTIRLVLPFLLLIFLSSCKRDVAGFAETPEIAYLGYDQYVNTNYPTPYDSIIIRLYFKDGDGDLGLRTSDTLPPYNFVDTPSQTEPNFYYYNYYCDIYKKFFGVYYPINFGSPFFNLNGRFKNLKETDRKEPIEGTLERYVVPNLPGNIFFQPGDTIKFSVYVIDRGLNQSNKVETEDIVLH